ncbi:S1C family serine protease [Pseudodesulfovibrio tunisiensis]|uniref:S1C family serine protease n=1 Tax=Pseudodesulfovibrio tunisiensis TaxID=463192 RepID=UPI001FB2FDAF|nr:S1C family serine protease [Pseudodesulfovibrio tunisiensis]
MRRFSSLVPIVLLSIVLMSCQAGKGGNGSLDSEAPDVQVKILMEQGYPDRAVAVVVAHEAWFASAAATNAEVRALLDRLKAGVDYLHAPEALAVQQEVAAIIWPVDRSGWPLVKADLERLGIRVDALRELACYRSPRFRPESLDKAVHAFEGRLAEIRRGAVRAFAVYPLFSGLDFFAEYPVPVDRETVLSENASHVAEALKKATPSQVAAFAQCHGDALPQSMRDSLGERYFLSLCPEPAGADLHDILAAYRKCTDAGYSLSRIPGVKVAFLQVTSPDLIRKKVLDFPIDVKLDVPFEAKKANMKTAFSSVTVKNADILILMNVAMSKARRSVSETERMESVFVASYGKEENPEYEIVRAELEAASEQYHAATSKSTTPWAWSILVHMAEESAKEDQVRDTATRLEQLKVKMRNTPKYISVPNYQPYMVTRAHMDVSKAATVDYYVVDQRSRTWFANTFDVRRKSYFAVCYDMMESDPDKDKFLGSSVLEDDVVRFEQEAVTVNLSDLLADFAADGAARKRYASLASVHREIVRDRNVALANLKKETFDFDRYHDRRFDSVVVVQNMGRGLGSGFYVTENLVLTNYHVVEENSFVKLRLFDERETFGKVVAKDVRLDLALIQADTMGRPVRFYSGRTMPLGETLEVIGHPNGHLFSVTRGIASSVRKASSVMGVKGKPVLFVQTDAAVNHGNSGGPLFWGNQVVGVNDWGDIRDGAVSLNFSIHYSEVCRFLKDNEVAYLTGSKQ